MVKSKLQSRTGRNLAGIFFGPMMIRQPPASLQAGSPAFSHDTATRHIVFVWVKEVVRIIEDQKTLFRMSSHRLFRFPKPQWINSANTRTAGVYFAGALVSHSFSHGIWGHQECMADYQYA